MTLIVEDGTVVAGADGYESAAVTAARLTGLGLSSFDGKTADEQESIIRRQTLAGEAFIGDGIEGSPVESTQPRLFPRARCWGTSGEIFDVDEIPEKLKAGIAFRCEDEAAGRITAGGREIEAVSRRGRSVRFRQSGSRFESESPEAANQLKGFIW